jgi:hypothetical protein
MFLDIKNKHMKRQNHVIECKRNASPAESRIRAQSLMNKLRRKGYPLKNGYIYVNCPTISDLFIVDCGILRECTTKEWGHYFRTLLHPPKVEVQAPLERVRRMVSL